MLTQSQIRVAWSPRCTGPFSRLDLYGSGAVYVKTAIVPAVRALDKVLIAYSYYTRAADTGAYNCRLNTSGTSYSTHAYGIALDINWQSNPYSRYLRTDMLRYGDGRMPHRICAIRTNNGKQVWNWGGFWSGNKDAMHYEIVCTPSDLRTGINLATVYGGGVVAPTPTPAPTPIQRKESPVYRIIWYKNGDGPSAAYRCLLGYAEWTQKWLVYDAVWIPNQDDLKIWKGRGLLEQNTGITPAGTRPSIAYHNGPYDNTKTY